MLSIRKIGSWGKTYRHLNRYSQILGILISYGFGDLVERLHIDQYIEKALHMLSDDWGASQTIDRDSRPRRIRMVLEELGPTAIKLGQLLSSRPDLFPPEYMEELTRLQDRAAPLPFEVVGEVVKTELGHNPEDIFDAFDPKPIASASIGQVHRARLKSGEPVAVKVQRPDIRRLVEVDLEIMLHFAMLLEKHIVEIALHQPVKIVEEFAEVLEEELDYNREANHIDRFSRMFLSNPHVMVPGVYHSLSTDRVLTMDFVQGIRISDKTALEEAGHELKTIIERGADIFLRQVFEHGFFHADPHPGNVRVLPGDVLCLLDFGMMGYIDDTTRGRFVDLLYAVVRKDESRAARMLLDITAWEEEPDMRLLERDLADLIGRYLHLPLKEIRAGVMMQQTFDLATRHHLRIPPGLFLMLKMLAMVEGIATRLDPDFDMAARALPFVKREKMERFHPRRLMEQALQLSEEFFTFLHDFPRGAVEVVQMIRDQKLSVRFEHKGLEQMVETHDRISNKVSFSIIIAALIIGSSILIIAGLPPLFHGISLIGIMVFTAAVIMGIWLMIAILRTGRF